MTSAHPPDLPHLPPGLSPAEVDRQKEYLEFSDVDVQLLASLQDLALEHVDDMIEALYAHFFRLDETRAFFTDPDVLRHAKEMQRAYFMGLSSGSYGADYVAGRHKVGTVHSDIGLDPKWYFGAFSFYFRQFSAVIQDEYADSPDDAFQRLMAFVKIVFLDMTISLDAYTRRQERALADKQRETQEARQQAEQANAAKSEFLSRMSHELRTPLNAVLGFGQLLEVSDLDPDQRESTGHILTAGHHLLDLVDEVLDIARIEAGELDLMVEPVALCDVLAEAVNLVRPAAEARDLTTSLHCPDDPHVLADQRRLSQILLNLLTNAVKYNRAGGSIAITIQVHAESHISIKVADTGIGIDPSMMERLFQPFDRLGAERTDVEGTGMGLALALSLSEAMGGSLTVASTPGQGSVFSLDLPSAQGGRSSSQGLKSTDDPTGSTQLRLTVLCIEDDSASLTLMARAIERFRPTTRFLGAGDGVSGLDLVRAEHPDLVLVDLHLPDIHGREVIAAIRSDPSTANTTIVVVSADATVAVMDQLLQDGADHYLTKPVDLQALMGLIDVIEQNLPAD